MRTLVGVLGTLAVAVGVASAHDPSSFEARAEYLLERQDVGALPTPMLVAMIGDPYPRSKVLALRIVAASTDPDQLLLLGQYARDLDLRVRYETMVAAGRFGPDARGIALRGLRDGAPRVRQAAAWAACHGGDELLEPLIERMAAETDTGVRATALANLWRFDEVDWEAHAAAAATGDDPQLRRAAAYSLARSDRPAAARPALRALAADADPVIRATAVAGLRRAPLAKDDLDVVVRALGDTDDRVRIAACWVLAEQAGPKLAAADAAVVAGLWRSTEPQLRVMALRAATRRTEIGADAELVRLARSAEPWAASTAAQAAIRRGADGSDALAGEWLAAGEPWQRRAVASAATALAPELENAARTDDEASVRLAWLDALSDGEAATRREALRSIVDGDPDPAVRAVALDRLVSSGGAGGLDELLGLAARWRDDASPAARAAALCAAIRVADGRDEIELVMGRARADRHPGVAVRVVNAARELGLPARPFEREPRHNRRWYADLVDWMTGQHWLDVVTDRGTFRIRLQPLEAPITSRELFDSAAAGVYDGTVFHRVVPDFVVQGGGSRGDGWGDPGFVLPDEPAYRPFDAWRVGIATDGPNTGGRQFFVTLMPADHLTGHYTNVGEVVAGRDVLTRLRAGDRIRSITTGSGDEPPPPAPVLLGELEWRRLAEIDGWAEMYNGYTPDRGAVERLASADGRYRIVTVLGTWCSDSEREVPRLVKVLDALPGEHFEHVMIGVDRSRRIDDDALAATAGVERTVERVPTIVVFDADGAELGRVVETAERPIEALLVEFLSPAEGW